MDLPRATMAKAVNERLDSIAPRWIVEDLIAAMAIDSTTLVATVGLQCSAFSYEWLLVGRKFARVGGTAAVAKLDGHTLNFSKEPLRYNHPKDMPSEAIPALHHWEPDTKRSEDSDTYDRWPICDLETGDGLERPRATDGLTKAF